MAINFFWRGKYRCRYLCRPALVLLVGLAFAGCAEIEGDKATFTRDLVNKATRTVNNFKTDPALTEFKTFLDEARAVVVLPIVVKAGFIGGGEAGSGVLLVRRDGGDWSYPAFYTLGAASFGLQVGIQGTEVVLILRSAKAIEAVLEHQAKFGADAGITVGLVGAGMEASTTTNMGADILAFAHSLIGAFGGISFEGAALIRRNDLNETYYGAPAAPRAIVIDGAFTNAGADGLRAALAKR